MIKYAVFIEPEGDLKKFICSYKEKIALALPGQPYCNHPPHSTLFVSILDEPSKWLDTLKLVIQKQGPFLLRVNSRIIFYDDILADGGHTIALKVEPSKQLFSLQLMVANTLRGFINKDEIDSASKFFTKEPFRSSYLKYGFAFVGEHWIPHFSIASLKISKTDKLIKDFENHSFDYTMTVKDISVWQVEQDKHRKITSLALKQG